MSKAKMNKVQKIAGVKASMLDRIPLAIQKKLTAELLAELCFVLYAEREEQFLKGFTPVGITAIRARLK